MKNESDVEILILHAEDDFDMIGKALRGKIRPHSARVFMRNNAKK